MIVAVNNVPASATIEITSDVSYVSAQFLRSSRLHVVGSVLLGRVFVSINDAPVFVNVGLQVAPSLSHDVVLGRDWQESVNKAIEPVPRVAHAAAGGEDVLLRSREGGACSVEEHWCDSVPAAYENEECDSATAMYENDSGYSVLYTNFFGSASTPSLFKSDLCQIQHLMHLHGLQGDAINIRSCRQLLVAHLAGGLCVNGSGQGCKVVSSRFDDPAKLSARILYDLSESKLSSIWPTENLRVIASSLGILYADAGHHVRRDIQSQLRAKADMLEATQAVVGTRLNDIFQSFERHNRATLISLCSQHYIGVSSEDSAEELRFLLCEHLVSGSCMDTGGIYCQSLRRQWLTSAHHDNWSIFFLTCIVESRVPLKPLQRLLKSANILFQAEDSLSQLRSNLKAYIRTLIKGKGRDDASLLPQDVESERFQSSKAKEIKDAIQLDSSAEMRSILDEIRSGWPSILPTSVKDDLIRMFQERTSSSSLSSATCASCAEGVIKAELIQLSTDDFDCNLLRRPDQRNEDNDDADGSQWLDEDPEYHPPLPLADDARLKSFHDVLLDPLGIVKVGPGDCLHLQVCKTCHRSLKRGRVPPLALANRTFMGPVPDELKNLTVVEEAMIARCRAKCWIVQLKEEFSNLELPNNQRGVKGHIIIYPQNASAVSNLLPPPMDDLTSPICVLFVGSRPPSQQWLRDKAKPLAVRPAVVRRALKWLKKHNPLYRDIVINEGLLTSLAETDTLPFSVQHIHSSEAVETQTSRYDVVEESVTNGDANRTPRGDITWQNVVITNVDGEASSNALRAAAFRHINERKGGYVQIPHEPTPVNEFIDPKLFPMIYPTLFPYGIGGFRDNDRESPLSMQRHVKHLFNLNDRRFQEHYSFLFTAFNMLQRHSILLHTKLKTQRSNFDKLAATVADVDAVTVHTVMERMSRGDMASEKWTEKETKLFSLLREVSAISSNVPGSVSARTSMRNEIRALMVDKGLPNFYLTINPADVYNPIVNVLAGADIDIDNLLDKDIVGYWTQSSLVAKNPGIAAKFFNVYMKAFISCLLRYDADARMPQPGVLGVVKAFYGCVEAQGRGTLHCHMLVWIEGGLNPNELKQKVLTDDDFKRRLLKYLDDIISNRVSDSSSDDVVVPSDKHHPCAVRGVKISTADPRQHIMRCKDMKNVVQQCQKHTHSRTCYKYFKGAPGERKECRFNLDENNVRRESVVDSETGEIFLRKEDGMINNFNATILEAIRCNMDIQFVGSGASAKAMIYYMTDYITKSSLKTHVALAALELAVNQSGKYNANEADTSVRAKALLRKCAYIMLSHQELSAPQVASYLMGYEDHFKSHEFVNLYWPSSERLIDKEDPSPECQHRRVSDVSKPAVATAQGRDTIEVAGAGDNDVHGVPDDDSDINLSAESDESSDAEEEVIVSVNSEGQLVASTDLSEDYRLRGDALKMMNLWEFRARIEKVKTIKSVKLMMRRPQTSSSSHFVYRKQIYVPLKKGHHQSETHILRCLPFAERRVPVPIGPPIPRRDVDEVFPRFCRLMLILFKPWFSSTDLRRAGQSWAEAFAEFVKNAGSDVLGRIENTQILHECRDSRDTHFAERRKRQRRTGFEDAVPADAAVSADGVFADDVSHEEVLAHLEQVQSCYDQKVDANRQKMIQCLSFAEAAGLYDTSACPCISPDDLPKSVVRVTDESIEDAWEHEYESRRSQWKKAAMSVACAPSNVGNNAASAQIDDGALIRESKSPNSETSNVTMQMPEIELSIESGGTPPTADIENIIIKWNLNLEQRFAFRIIAERSLEDTPAQLRMFLSGPGGAGKSRVVNALREYFEKKGEVRRLRLASFTGVAARNIMGITLHASLFLNHRVGKRIQAKTLRDLMAVWEGVDFLVVDEVSMIGCGLLHDISKALTEAKSDSRPFGGIHIVFVGDFAQLPPVCETRLYARINPYCKGGAIEQKKIFGKLLWLSVDVVVMLTEIKRQTGSENDQFVELLGRLRNGRCTLQDFTLLNSRLLSKTNAIRNNPSMWNTPILVTQNSVKDFLNEKGAEAFSRRVGRQLHWYYAVDKVNGQEVKEQRLKDHLRGLSTSQTNQRLGRLPLVIGMPVMITQNFDVEHGIVNGSMGVLKRIRYTVDENGDRHATSCVVQIPDMTGPAMRNLDIGEAAVIRDTVTMNFRHPFSGRNCTIKRIQLPIVPAFCLTVHKAQGQTMEKAIVDIEDCRGTEPPYVMLSRVKSLQGLHIIRPFHYKKITVHPSQESRVEFQRLELLRLQTLKQYGTPQQKETADKALNGAAIMFGDLDHLDLSKPAPKQLLADAQQTVVEQTSILESYDESALPSSRKRFRHISLDAVRRVRRRID